MNDEELRRAYQRRVAGRPPDRSACPPPDALAAVVDGSASEAERLATLRHVGGCADCRADLDLLRTAVDAAAGDAARWWTSAPALAMAAVLVLAVGGVALWQRSAPPSGDILRNSAAAAVITVAPGDGAAGVGPVRLVWHAVSDAQRYEVEVLDSAGAPVFQRATADTAVEVSGLPAGAEYRWWVQARQRDGGQPRSVLRRFRITTTQ
jgi:hypothetical protein